MINLQYNQEAEFEIIRQEAKEEGIAEGIEQGKLQKVFYKQACR